jgi:hypothetical protein
LLVVFLSVILRYRVDKTDNPSRVTMSYGGLVAESRLAPGASAYFSYAVREVYDLNVYDPPPELIQRVDTLIDIGATAGESTLKLATMFRPRRVVTVDPNSDIRITGVEHEHYREAVSDVWGFVSKHKRGKTLVKVDCEGCEISLKPEHLEDRSVLWIIELHPIFGSRHEQHAKELYSGCRRIGRICLLKKHPEQPVPILFVF